MIEPRQDLSFTAEAFPSGFGQHGRADDFDRYSFAKRAIDADRFVHCPHTAAADLADHFIRADAGAGEILIAVWGGGLGRQRHHWPV